MKHIKVRGTYNPATDTVEMVVIHQSHTGRQFGGGLARQEGYDPNVYFHGRVRLRAKEESPRFSVEAGQWGVFVTLGREPSPRPSTYL